MVSWDRCERASSWLSVLQVFTEGQVERVVSVHPGPPTPGPSWGHLGGTSCPSYRLGVWVSEAGHLARGREELRSGRERNRGWPGTTAE